MTRKHLLPILLCACALALVACERKGPVERAGEHVDHSVDTLKNGGKEPLGDKLQDKADKAQSKLNDATDSHNPP